MVKEGQSMSQSSVVEGFSITELLLSSTEATQLSSRARTFSLLTEQNTDVKNVLTSFSNSRVFLFLEMHIFEIYWDYNARFIFCYSLDVLM